MIGYEPPPEEYKERLEETYRGEDTFLSLRKSHEKNPDDLETAAKLCEKYMIKYDVENAVSLAGTLLENPEKAKSIILPYEEAEVSAYEFAKYTLIYEDCAEISNFMNEFPGTILKNRVFRRLSRYYRDEGTRDIASKIYDELMPEYGSETNFISPYLYYSARYKIDTEKAMVVADKYYQQNQEKADDNFRRNYADLLLQNGDDRKAAEVYGKNIFDQYAKADNADGLNGYAWFWAERGKNLESALDAAKLSINLKDSHYTWDTLSMVYWKMGSYDEAIRAEETALKMIGDSNEEYEKRIKEIKADMETDK